ncbi:hypothetical protein AB0P36_32020 [Streptomyces flavidovirens]|uniref:hypothetical protein n=1 Tax=Streptomyces flavidovirens TaxID=67298 RepID=UPI0034393925
MRLHHVWSTTARAVAHQLTDAGFGPGLHRGARIASQARPEHRSAVRVAPSHPPQQIKPAPHALRRLAPPPHQREVR